MPLADLPECWQEILAPCCEEQVVCSSLTATPEGQFDYATVENVSGCECMDGEVFVGGGAPSGGNYTAGYLHPDPTDTTCPMAMQQIDLICTAPDTLAIVINWTQLPSHVFAAGGSTSDNTVQIISFNADPFSLVVEFDVLSGSTFCFPGRLRVTITRM